MLVRPVCADGQLEVQSEQIDGQTETQRSGASVLRHEQWKLAWPLTDTDVFCNDTYRVRIKELLALRFTLDLHASVRIFSLSVARNLPTHTALASTLPDDFEESLAKLQGVRRIMGATMISCAQRDHAPRSVHTTFRQRNDVMCLQVPMPI